MMLICRLDYFQKRQHENGRYVSPLVRQDLRLPRSECEFGQILNFTLAAAQESVLDRLRRRE